MSLAPAARLSALVAGSEASSRGSTTGGRINSVISSTVRYGYLPPGEADLVASGAGVNVVGTEPVRSGSPGDDAPDILVDFTEIGLSKIERSMMRPAQRMYEREKER